MNRDVLIWFGLAAAAGFAATGALMSGDAPWLLSVVSVLALACAVHAPSRTRMTSAAGRLVSRGTLRAALIVIGAISLIQFLPLELALFAAGDVLAYVEVLAAVSLIAANVRLRVAGAAIRTRFERRRSAARQRTGRAAPRSVRARRPRGPQAPADDPAAWAFA